MVKGASVTKWDEFTSAGMTRDSLTADRVRKIIPMATQTNSKGPHQFIEGVHPAFIVRGEGPYLITADGKKYIDTLSALGAVILGYNSVEVDNAVKEAVYQYGSGVFSLPHTLEYELADVLVKRIPGCDMVRFAKNGVDVCAAAVRLSRAYTKREKILSIGYHGHWDQFVVNTPKNGGVLKSLHKYLVEFPFDRIEDAIIRIKTGKDKFACAIVECPPITELHGKYLHKLNEVCQHTGTVFIMDEILTWGRYGTGGMSEMYELEPDIVTCGKAMGNGYSITALCGTRGIMKQLEDNVFFSSTFSGEVLGMAAAKECIAQIESKKVSDKIRTWGKAAMNHFNAYMTSGDNQFALEGDGTRMKIVSKGGDCVLLSQAALLESNLILMPNGPIVPNMGHVNSIQPLDFACMLISATDRVGSEVLQGKSPVPTVMQR